MSYAEPQAVVTPVTAVAIFIVTGVEEVLGAPDFDICGRAEDRPGRRQLAERRSVKGTN
jgi:hypothetical protein